MTAESGKPPPEDPEEEQPAPPEAPQFIPPAGAPPPPPPPAPGQPPPPPPPPAPGAPQFIPPVGGGLPPPPPPGTGLPGEHGLPPPPPVGAPTFQPPSGPPAPPHPAYAQPGAPTFGPYTLASWGSRVGAVLLDGLFAGLPVLIIVLVATSADGILPALLANALVFAVYYPATMMRQGARNGQTLGKQVVGIRVIREDGRPVTYGVALLREFVIKFLLFNVAGSITFGIAALLDVLWPLWDDGNRALHDMLASTRVVRA